MSGSGYQNPEDMEWQINYGNKTSNPEDVLYEKDFRSPVMLPVQVYAGDEKKDWKVEVIQSVGSFSSGFTISLDNNFTFGGIQAILNPPKDYSFSFNLGKVFGDAYSLAAGGSMLIGGGAETGGGLLVTASGFGSPIGVPLTLSGASTIAYGGTVALNAGRNLIKDSRELYLNAKTDSSNAGGKTYNVNGKILHENEFTALRQKAVNQAWKQEKELVETTGKGTREWTEAEKQELLATGKVKGYEGQHMKSAEAYPNHAGDPNNIQFLKG